MDGQCPLNLNFAQNLLVNKTNWNCSSSIYV